MARRGGLGSPQSMVRRQLLFAYGGPLGLAISGGSLTAIAAALIIGPIVNPKIIEFVGSAQAQIGGLTTHG